MVKSKIYWHEEKLNLVSFTYTTFPNNEYKFLAQFNCRIGSKILYEDLVVRKESPSWPTNKSFRQSDLFCKVVDLKFKLMNVNFVFDFIFPSLKCCSIFCIKNCDFSWIANRIFACPVSFLLDEKFLEHAILMSHLLNRRFCTFTIATLGIYF